MAVREATGGVRTVYRWEMIKLAALRRGWVVLAGCLVGPFAFLVLLKMQQQLPQDTLFGRWVRESGYATPLLVLGFAAQWAFPFLTSVVAGDMFSAEDHHGTWKTILTRSRGRGELFAGKVLAAATYAVAAVAVLGLASLTAGVLLIGTQPLVGLSGQLIAPGHAALLVLAAWATTIPPVLGFTAIGLLASAASRHTAVGVLVPVAASNAVPTSVSAELAAVAGEYGDLPAGSR